MRINGEQWQVLIFKLGTIERIMQRKVEEEQMRPSQTDELLTQVVAELRDVSRKLDAIAGRKL